MIARAPHPPELTADSVDVRARVLEASIRLIKERGLADLSMREVARLAGVSHQAPYHYFADREAILATIASDGFEILVASLTAARAGVTSATEQLTRAGNAYVAFACEHTAHFRVMFRADVVHVDRFPELIACGDRAFRCLPEIVQAAIAEGMPALPSETAHVVLYWSVCHGLACLLIDGPLAKKLPELANARERLTRDVMAAMKSLIEAQIAGAHRERPRARARNARRQKAVGARGRSSRS